MKRSFSLLSKCPLVVVFTLFTLNGVAQKSEGFVKGKISQVFVSGEGGYRMIRIPSITRLSNGDLLAFAEGRINGQANFEDFGDVDVVMKRSNDNGQTWSPLQVVATYDTLQAGNPATVVDLTDPRYPKGRIFLFYNTGTVTQNDLRKGLGKRLVWYKTSIDNGKTWSAPIDITSQVKKSTWRTYANTPGHAIQISAGKYAGRIYVAANTSEGDPQPNYEDYNAIGFYTDDHGKTFHVSEKVSFPGSNESMAVELCDDKLMMNIRNQTGYPKCRIVAISSDGGVHWDTTYYDYQLPDPVCQGSILKLECIEWNRHTILATCNVGDTLRRRNLTLRISSNSGKTWGRECLVDTENVHTSYSDLVKISEAEIGVLYERKNFSEVVFRVIKW